MPTLSLLQKCNLQQEGRNTDQPPTPPSTPSFPPQKNPVDDSPCNHHQLSTQNTGTNIAARDNHVMQCGPVVCLCVEWFYTRQVIIPIIATTHVDDFVHNSHSCTCTVITKWGHKSLSKTTVHTLKKLELFKWHSAKNIHTQTRTHWWHCNFQSSVWN